MEAELSEREREIEEERSSRARDVRKSFELFDDVFLLGSLQTGVTVYNQQVRAHNLVWALSQIAKDEGRKPNSIAVVGGGISGLTTAACCMAMFPESELSLFEKQWELCPLQLGSDNRWIHPKIYDWPDPGSRLPSAGLPLLDWREGRASDVARQVIGKFSASFEASASAKRLYLGTRHLKIDQNQREIEWSGTETTLQGGFLKFGRTRGDKDKFDVIILATGFGIENSSDISEAGSYWQNERLGQPVFDGRKTSYVVSGSGDGALVDLCRLVVSRFRQDTIVYELFVSNLDETERHLEAVKTKVIANPNRAYRIIDEEFRDRLSGLVDAVHQRVRNDTRVVMHLTGNPCEPKGSMEEVFSGGASFLNKITFFALYRAGAFIPHFGTLEEVIAEYGIEPKCVLVRHGTDPVAVLTRLFPDSTGLEDQICRMRTEGVQTKERCWVPGCFPTPRKRTNEH